MSELKSILILKLSSLGDVIHTLPLVNVLRRKYPDSRIGWAIEKKFVGLIEGHPSVDELIVFERGKSLFKTLFPFLRVVKKIRSMKYEIIMDLQGSLKGSLFVLLGGSRRRMGFKRGSSRIDTVSTFFTNWKVIEEGSHIIERNLCFARAIGVEDIDISFKIAVKEFARRRVEDFLKARSIHYKRTVILHPGVTWETRMWPWENYSALAEQITEKFPNTAIVITVGPGEESLGEKIQKNCSADTTLAGNISLQELVALVDRCELFVSSNTGPLHLACALGKTTIGFYGPTDPVRYLLDGKKNFVFWKELPCSGCWRRKCKTIKCMKEIGVSEVMKKVSMCLEEQLVPSSQKRED